jgi:hypothetical protein
MEHSDLLLGGASGVLHHALVVVGGAIISADGGQDSGTGLNAAVCIALGTWSVVEKLDVLFSGAGSILQEAWVIVGVSVIATDRGKHSVAGSDLAAFEAHFLSAWTFMKHCDLSVGSASSGFHGAFVVICNTVISAHWCI